MATSLMPLIAGVLVCLTTASVTAADQINPSPTSADLRTEVDHKREHITGADAITKTAANGSQSVLVSPIDTTDAPTVEDDK